MEKTIDILKSLKLWHFSLLGSAILLFLGFTGNVPFLDIELRDGIDMLAIGVGVGFFVSGCVLIYVPPPSAR